MAVEKRGTRKKEERDGRKWVISEEVYDAIHTHTHTHTHHIINVTLYNLFTFDGS